MQDVADQEPLNARLDRIAAALELIAGGLAGSSGRAPFDATEAEAFVWRADVQAFEAVHLVNRVPIGLIVGVDQVRDQLLENTRRFAEGLPANNVLLWGARGMGKSSLVKAAHAACVGEHGLKLVEIHREDIASVPVVLAELAKQEHRFVLFCDDLSFDHDDASYKSLKVVLDGGLAGRPRNVLFYATSNRRHLLPRDMMENERATAINPSEAIEEKVSLSDRFGLWLGFHRCSQDEYLEMVARYASHFELPIEAGELKARAIEWSATRGARSGRVAWQFIQHLAGELGIALEAEARPRSQTRSIS